MAVKLFDTTPVAISDERRLATGSASSDSEGWNTYAELVAWLNTKSIDAGTLEGSTLAQIVADYVSKTYIDGLGIDAATLGSLDSSRIYRSAASTFTSGDWDNITTHGVHKISHADFTGDTNPPPASYAYGILNVDVSEIGGEGRVNQVYTPHSDSLDKYIYQRMRNTGAWTSWSKIWRGGTGSGSGLDAATLEGLTASEVGSTAGTWTPTLYDTTSGSPIGFYAAGTHAAYLDDKGTVTLHLRLVRDLDTIVTPSRLIIGNLPFAADLNYNGVGVIGDYAELDSGGSMQLSVSGTEIEFLINTTDGTDYLLGGYTLGANAFFDIVVTYKKL